MIDYVVDWKAQHSARQRYIWARYGKDEGMLRKLICKRICTCKLILLLFDDCGGGGWAWAVVFSVILRESGVLSRQRPLSAKRVWWLIQGITPNEHWGSQDRRTATIVNCLTRRFKFIPGVSGELHPIWISPRRVYSEVTKYDPDYKW